MVVVGKGTAASQINNTNYPYDDGLVAGTTSQIGHQETLIAEHDLTSEKDGIGIN